MPGKQERPRSDPASAPAARESRRTGENRRGARRATERHYVAVVAAEARLLARQLRPPANGRAGTRGPIRGSGAEVLP
jgi:hypothetical protein